MLYRNQENLRKIFKNINFHHIPLEFIKEVKIINSNGINRTVDGLELEIILNSKLTFAEQGIDKISTKIDFEKAMSAVVYLSDKILSPII